MKQTLQGLKALGRFCSHVNLVAMLAMYALAFTADKLMRLTRNRSRKESFNSNRIYEKGFGMSVHA